MNIVPFLFLKIALLKKYVNANNINVTNCALAAIKFFKQYKDAIVIANESTVLLLIFLLIANITSPNKIDNMQVA